MRAVIIANPRATAAARGYPQQVARRLADVVQVEAVQLTGDRDHATELGASARKDGADVVVVIGGDGTVNEVLQGLLDGHGGPEDDPPLLGVVPVGSTNVFARALGLPNDADAAIAALCRGLEHPRERRVGLGQADGRWFTFAAGLGLDAAVVAAVERRRRAGRRSTPQLYARLAFEEFVRARRRPARVTLASPRKEPIEQLALTLVTNTSPWTYLRSRAVNPTPQASFDTGLDVYARRSLHARGVLRGIRWAVRPEPARTADPGEVVLHDLHEFTLSTDEPLPFQLDGDYLGPRTTVRFVARPRALRVIC